MCFFIRKNFLYKILFLNLPEFFLKGTISKIDMGEAIFLMIVGMVTVFTVLLLVVGIGNVIIRFVNRFLPEEVAAKPATSAAPAINPNVYSAICSAVSTVTGGKGTVVDVKKL